MTDRELLEKAAKAAGIAGHYKEAEGVFAGGIFYNDELDCLRCWNPLEDDGDALRLAGKLRIQIEHMKTLKGEDFGVNCWPSGRGDCGVSEDGDLSDYMASMRRAIVRAAAGLADAPGAA